MSQSESSLTPGVVSKILKDGDGDGILSSEEVYVQVLGTKVISSEEKKYRLCISDGVHRTSTVLFRPQSLTLTNPPQNNSIINIGNKRSYVEIIRGRTAWFINSFKVISSPSEQIGSPINFSQSIATPEASCDTERKVSIPNTPVKRPLTDKDDGKLAKRKLNFNSASSLSTHEIRNLNPFTNKYKIVCRVTSKGTLRKWSNSRGEGVVFNVTLQDVSGEILATGFNETAKKLFPILVEGKAFCISGAQIKAVKDRRYNSTGHNYEMGLTEHTVVVPVDDSSSDSLKIPKLQIDITKLSDIADKVSNDVVNVVGIVVSFGSIQEISVSQGARTVLKRDMTLRDNSGECMGGSTVNVTLWDAKTNIDDGKIEVEKKYYCFTNAKVSDWKGKSLSAGSGSTLIFDPDLPQAKLLYQWWNSSQQSVSNNTFNSLSQDSNKSSGSTDKYFCLSEIVDEFKNNVDDGKVGYYVLSAVYITEIKRDKLMFKACETCHKKVSETTKNNTNGDQEISEKVYICRSCNTHSNHFIWRYILNVGLADFSGHNWATVFDLVAFKMFGGMHATDLNNIMENNFNEFNQHIHSCQYNRWWLKIKAKVETWQKATRLKLIVIDCEKVNNKSENERLQSETETLECKYLSLSL
nr:LOW QUALITY PROTEIN: replication protein A 70 kDa DNA-binding subunit-like [Lepeophtheirus salmonis]